MGWKQLHERFRLDQCSGWECWDFVIQWVFEWTLPL
jgi:hypothetical protein